MIGSSSLPLSKKSWFNSTFGSSTPDRSKELEATTIEIPQCAICLEKVSDPIALKCGHIFDKHCIKKCLNKGHNQCPLDRGIVNEEEFKECHEIYEKTKCKIKAVFFSDSGYSSVCAEASIFSTMEKVQEKVISQYLKDFGKEEVPAVESMTVQGSFTFYPGKTLADYQVFPGEETLMWVFLA